MKTILLVLPLAGAAILAFASEHSKPDTAGSTTSLSVTNSATDSSGVNMSGAEQAGVAKFGERLDLSGALTLKSPRPPGPAWWQPLNLLAPVETTPATRWVAREPWIAVAGRAGRPPSAVEQRHEPQFGVVLCRR
jgi:hypothetical protein